MQETCSSWNKVTKKDVMQKEKHEALWHFLFYCTIMSFRLSDLGNCVPLELEISLLYLSAQNYTTQT
jgi:hypothetical protein